MSLQRHLLLQSCLPYGLWAASRRHSLSVHRGDTLASTLSCPCVHTCVHACVSVCACLCVCMRFSDPHDLRPPSATVSGFLGGTGVAPQSFLWGLWFRSSPAVLRGSSNSAECSGTTWRGGLNQGQSHVRQGPYPVFPASQLHFHAASLKQDFYLVGGEAGSAQGSVLRAHTCCCLWGACLWCCGLNWGHACRPAP